MFLVSYTTGEDFYDHRKIGDYSRQIFPDDESAKSRFFEWNLSCARMIERERIPWYTIQLVSLQDGAILATTTKLLPLRERKRINIKVKPLTEKPKVYEYTDLLAHWDQVDQQAEEQAND